LEHVEQAVFEVPEHVPLMYCPDVHPAHDLHAKPLLVPLHDPTRYCWLPQLMLEHELQVNPFVVPPHSPARYCIVPHSLLLHAKHMLSL
jgi:hypothetical protein